MRESKQFKPNGAFILDSNKIDAFLNADTSAKKLLERFQKHHRNPGCIISCGIGKGLDEDV